MTENIDFDNVCENCHTTTNVSISNALVNGGKLCKKCDSLARAIIEEAPLWKLAKLWAAFENSNYYSERKIRNLRDKIDRAIIEIEKKGFRYEDFLKWESEQSNFRNT